MKQSILPSKLKMTEELITSHCGLAIYAEFLKPMPSGLPRECWSITPVSCKSSI